MRLSCPSCRKSTDTDLGDSQTIVCPNCSTQIDVAELISTVSNATGETRGLPAGHLEFETGNNISHFRLDDVLGNGGFGIVYKAYDQRLQRNVAVKVPRINSMTRSQAEIFLCEAQAAAQLHHPNIVPVFEVGRENDRIYIVSALIEGKTLKDWSMLDSPDRHEMVKMVSKIARALQTAHSAGIVHRDIKPRNIIVDNEQEPHVTDFGLAKRNAALSSPFQAGQVVGTESYMSPEQTKGDPDAVDHRSDIYSLGIVLFELIHGYRPLESKQIGQAVSSVPIELDAICNRAISLDPVQRFQNCEEFADELDRWLQGLPTKTLPPTRLQSAARLFKRNARYIALVAIGLLIGMFGIAVAWSELGNKPDDLSKTETPPEGHKYIEISVSPRDSRLKVVKVDENAAWIDYSNIVELESYRSEMDSDVFKTTLTPGWYIFEAVAPNGDIAEVWRLVPENINGSPVSQYRPTDWVKLKTHTVQLHSIDVVPLNRSDYVFYEGGSFVTSTDLFDADNFSKRPAAKVTLSDFLIAPKEVSLNDFNSVMNTLPYEYPEKRVNFERDGNVAANHVRFIEAIDYAERVGGRLPILEEYLFAATNRGKTTFPWGDKWIFKDWMIGPVGEPAEDRNADGVYNLYSNVCEWAGDYSIPDWVFVEEKFPDDFAAQAKHLEQIRTHRMIVGGRHVSTGSLPHFPACPDTPRRILAFPTDNVLTTPEGVGFRVYRSITPRLDASSEIIQYYVRSRENKLLRSRRRPNNGASVSQSGD